MLLGKSKSGWLEAKANDNLCVVPWSHTFISPQSERRLCCASREKSSFVQQYIDQAGESGSEYKPQNLEDHWNSEYMRNIRLKMLRGEKLKECEVCHDKVLNLSIYKDWFNKALFPDLLKKVHLHTEEDGRTDLKPISYDYRIHNTCNFKCRMCGEQLSSAWESEKRKFQDWNYEYDVWMRPDVRSKIKSFQSSVVEKELISAIENKELKEIYWVGGEPLTWNLHWDMMKKMIAIDLAKEVFCRYNTNLSIIEQNGIHLGKDLLPHFKGYLICASIDGAGKNGEWIRTGLDWDVFLRNFKELQNSKGGKESIAFDVTLTLPGLFSLKELFDVALDLQTQVITKIIFAFDPYVVLSPLALPKVVLHELLDELISYIQPRVNSKTQSILDTLYDLKSRPTFEESYPRDYKIAFYKGRENQQKLAGRRGDGELNKAVLLEDIYRASPSVYDWWTQNEIS